MPETDGSASVESSLYECVDCQKRVEDPASRTCECGGYLRNIGIPRGK
jgi:hypothetical protein